MFKQIAIAVSALFIYAASAYAQQGYEFEVYGTELAPKGVRELEIHTNFVPSGAQRFDQSEGRATHHAYRSSIELGSSLTSWLQANVYAVAYARSGAGLQYVGNRLRLTGVAPEKWRLPFGLGLSQEVGYARPGFAENRWAYEVTPILQKEINRVTFVLNPAFEHGLDRGAHEWEFEPRSALSYTLGDDEEIGLEYYSVLGPVTAFDPQSHQRHQIFVTAKTELPFGIDGGFGVGRGFTRNSDRWVITSRLELEF